MVSKAEYYEILLEQLLEWTNGVLVDVHNGVSTDKKGIEKIGLTIKVITEKFEKYKKWLEIEKQFNLEVKENVKKDR
jgi:hypothetical protein